MGSERRNSNGTIPPRSLCSKVDVGLARLVCRFGRRFQPGFVVVVFSKTFLILEQHTVLTKDSSSQALETKTLANK